MREHQVAVGGTRTARAGIVLADVPELVDEQPLREPCPGHDIRGRADVHEGGREEKRLVDRALTGGGRRQHRDRRP